MKKKEEEEKKNPVKKHMPNHFNSKYTVLTR